MQEKIQNVLQRNSFSAQCTATGVVLIILNYAFYFYEQIGKETSPYRAWLRLYAL